MSHQQQNFNSPGSSTWTVPTAVKAFTAYIVGGGGGGGSGSNGGGGGGGGYADKSYTGVSPGATYSYLIGAGGAGDSQDGTSSNFNSDISASGGIGSAGSSGGSPGGPGGSYDHGQSGGTGGSGTTCCSDCCDDCESVCTDPPDCNTFEDQCQSTSTPCNDYSGGGGASGSLGADGGSGSGADCSCGPTQTCGSSTFDCGCGNTGNGGSPNTSYSSDGGGGSGGTAGGGGYPGGGAGGNNATGGDGLFQVVFESGHLTITTQPSNTPAGNAISPAVVVQVRFDDGTVDTSYTGTVSVAINNNPAGGTLSGTTTVNAVAGVATFSNLHIDNAGSGYTLDFTCTDVDTATSNPFDITQGDRNVDVSDSVSVTEFVKLLEIDTINKFESVSVTESTTELVTDFINKNDTVTITESVALQVVTVLNISVNDSITVTDAPTVRTTENPSVSDSTSIAESTTVVITPLVINISDSITVSDVPTVALVQTISKSESITVTDVDFATQVYTIAVSDAVSVAETISSTTSVSINVSQSITVTESVGVAPPIVISVSDSVAVSDGSNTIKIAGSPGNNFDSSHYLYIAQLTALGRQLPAGEDSRYQTISVSGGPRQIVAFNDSSDQECIWTIPYWPALGASGTPYIEIQWFASTTSGAQVVWRVQVEAVTPNADTLDLGGSTSFDSANDKTETLISAPAGRLIRTTITLTNNDSVAAGDLVRIKIIRVGTSGSDTLSGDARLVGAIIRSGNTPFSTVDTGFGTPYRGIYGDGSDGNANITTNTTLSRDAYYNSLSLTSGATLNLNGYRLHVASQLSIGVGCTVLAPPGTSQNHDTNYNHSGFGGLALTGMYETAQGAYGGSFLNPNVGIPSWTYGPIAGVSGNGTTPTGIILRNTIYGASNSWSGNGGAGGAAGSFLGGAGGLGSGGNYTPRREVYDPFIATDGTSIFMMGGAKSGGAGGGVGAANSINSVGGGGGGGGNGGGVAWIAARTITNNGTIKAEGEAGGRGGLSLAWDASPASGGGGGGGGGAGGLIVIISNWGIGGTLSVAGGAGGAGGGVTNTVVTTYTTPGDYTIAIPSSAASVAAEAWGAGGNGNVGQTNSGSPGTGYGGGGGAGGNYALGGFVDAGHTYDVHVPTQGTDGDWASFNFQPFSTSLTAVAGNGGNHNTQNSGGSSSGLVRGYQTGIGGSGGTGSGDAGAPSNPGGGGGGGGGAGGDNWLATGTGANGTAGTTANVANTLGGAGGAGGDCAANHGTNIINDDWIPSTVPGNGGNGGNAGVAGVNGTFPGGGGGGGGGNPAAAGGTGAGGQVRVYYLLKTDPQFGTTNSTNTGSNGADGQAGKAGTIVQFATNPQIYGYYT